MLKDSNFAENKNERSMQTSRRNNVYQRKKTRLEFNVAKKSKKSKKSFKILGAKKRNLI